MTGEQLFFRNFFASVCAEVANSSLCGYSKLRSAESFAMKATIRSIAKEANVSPATVSRVLSGSTQVTPRMRSHVLNIARKLGYHSAGIRNVALIAGGNFFSGYDALLLQALHEELRHRNYRAVLVTTSDLDALDDCVIAGAISIAYQDGREKLWIRNRALPMICINATGYHLDGIYKVYSNEQQGIELALEHFYKFGHRNLGLVTYSSHLPGPLGLSLRIEAFHRYLVKRGCTGTAVNMIDCSRAIDAVRKLLDSGVTAILAAGESVGLPVAHALNLFRIRIPEDVSMISMESRRVSEYLTPPHTTIEQRMDRLAAEAVSLLEQQWNGEQPSADIAVDYCLRSRDSVAPLPRS